MVASRNTVLDFIDRTVRNLKFAERLAREDPKKFFEVTQLVNSTLGMLFVPVENKLDKIPKIDISRILNGSTGPLVIEGDLSRHFGNLRLALKTLRNCFAHENFEFQNDNNVIVGIYLWKYPELKAKIPDFVCYISIPDLRCILLRASKELQDIDDFQKTKNKLSELEGNLGKKIRLDDSAMEVYSGEH